MNTTATAALMLTSLAIQGNPITYRDKAGNMEVRAQKFSMKLDEQTNLWSFVGVGPFSAKWLKQKITITGNRLSGTMAPTGPANNQSFELRDGEFTGNIVAKMEDAGKRGTVTITGLSRFAIKSISDGKQWSIDGDGAPFVANLPDSGATVTGRSFEGTLDRTIVNGAETPEWRFAKFTGGVRAILKQTDKKSKKPFTLDATCPTVTIDRATYTMTLTGGVVIDGDHPALGPLGAEITAPKIILEFDKEMRVLKSVTMERP